MTATVTLMTVCDSESESSKMSITVTIESFTKVRLCVLSVSKQCQLLGC